MSSEQNKIYTVAIIGAGRIGCGIDGPDSPRVLTHAHAFSSNECTRLIGIVDTDRNKGEREAQRWNTEYFADADDLFNRSKPDIVVIATPDSTHANLLAHVYEESPRLIVCEKPVFTDPNDRSRIEALARGDIPVIVNFNRRFDPSMQELAESIRRGTFGAVISASAVYARGTLHNGSHLFDLARLLFGEMKSASRFGSITDLSEDDPTFGGFAQFERCERFYVMPADGRQYSLFEFDILTERRRIRLIDEGAACIVQEATDDPVYPGFRMPGPEKREETSLAHSMERLAAHAVACIEGNATPISSLESALKTQAACMAFAGKEK